MPDIIKKMSIKVAGGSTYDTRDIGAEAENIVITKDSSGKIVPVSQGTGGTTETLVDTLNNFGGGAFVGTQAEWNALSADEKAKYDYENGSTVNITDDNDTLDDDISEDAITFTSADMDDSGVTASTSWLTVAKVTTGESLKNLFNKMSSMFRNIRVLNKRLGTPSEASDVDGTTAFTKINTLNSNSEYKYLGNTVLGNSMALPSNWKALIVITGNGDSKPQIEFTVPRTYPGEDKTNELSNGYYGGTNWYGYARIHINKGWVKLDEYTHNGTTPSRALIYVYYR